MNGAGSYCLSAMQWGNSVCKCRESVSIYDPSPDSTVKLARIIIMISGYTVLTTVLKIPLLNINTTMCQHENKGYVLAKLN